MKVEIQVSGEMPTLEILKKNLIENYPDYPVKIWGLGPGKSVRLKKSALVGTRIFVSEKKGKIIVGEDMGNYLAAVLFVLFTGFIGILFIRPKAKVFLKDVGDYLGKLYGTK